MDSRPIGIFDSGVGGLTVVEEARRRMPQENIIYLGDTARTPYGAKSRETLLGYGREIIQFLVDCDVKAVIIACGTISSNAYDELTAAFPELPIIDVIRPGVNACADAKPERVGFIATEATVRSGMFAALLTEKVPSVTVCARACPLFVPLAEEGWTQNAVTQLAAEIYLADWRNAKLDALVLGCTHYPLLTAVIKNILGVTPLINMAEYTVRAAQAQLAERGLLNEHNTTPEYRFCVSGYTDKFNRMANIILQEPFIAEKISFDK